jgi:hypothetical protein
VVEKKKKKEEVEEVCLLPARYISRLDIAVELSTLPNKVLSHLLHVGTST